MNTFDSPGSRLEQRQEQAIDALTRCYAEDYLDTPQFEAKLSLVNSATSIRSLEDVMADLPRQYQLPELHQADRVTTPQSFTTIMSDRKISHELVQAGQASCFNLMGDTVFDLREVPIPPGDLHLNVTCIMGDIKIFLPNHVQVDNQVQTILADAKTKGQCMPSGDTKLYITGLAIMADIKVRYT